MTRVLLSPLLLLLLVFASSPGGAPSLAHAQDCMSADVVVKETRMKVIKSTDIEGSEGSISAFIRHFDQWPFEGVRLDVYVGEGSQYSAWYPADQQCFPWDRRWQQIKAWVRLDRDNTRLSLGYDTGPCLRGCVLTNASQTLQNLTTTSRVLHNLTIVGYGSSRWIKKTPPSGCDITYAVSSTSKPNFFIACAAPPPPPTPASIVMMVVMIALLCLISTLLITGLVYFRLYIMKR